MHCVGTTVPASIDKTRSSGNVAVQEGRDISITCSVFGIPSPEITWYRRADQQKDTDKGRCQLATRSMSLMQRLQPWGSESSQIKPSNCFSWRLKN